MNQPADPKPACVHGIRWPHECSPCADAAWSAETARAAESDPKAQPTNPKTEEAAQEINGLMDRLQAITWQAAQLSVYDSAKHEELAAKQRAARQDIRDHASLRVIAALEARAKVHLSVSGPMDDATKESLTEMIGHVVRAKADARAVDEAMVRRALDGIDAYRRTRRLVTEEGCMRAALEAYEKGRGE